MFEGVRAGADNWGEQIFASLDSQKSSPLRDILDKKSPERYTGRVCGKRRELEEREQLATRRHDSRRSIIPRPSAIMDATTQAQAALGTHQVGQCTFTLSVQVVPLPSIESAICLTANEIRGGV